MNNFTPVPVNERVRPIVMRVTAPDNRWPYQLAPRMPRVSAFSVEKKMDSGNHEMSISELDGVSGGGPLGDIVKGVIGNAIWEGIKWIVSNGGPAIYNSSGRGDDNGCTGHYC